MGLYTLGKFVHTAAAIVLVGSYLLAPVLHAAIRGATDLRALRALARLQQRVITASGPAAVGVLASGVYMTLAGWSFTESWIAVALVLFAANGALAMSVVDPHVKKLLAAADEASDGPLARDLTDLVHDARVVGALRVVVGVDVAIIFLMVNKPGWAGSVAVAGTSLALGASLAAVASRRTRQPVRSHAAAEWPRHASYRLPPGGSRPLPELGQRPNATPNCAVCASRTRHRPHPPNSSVTRAVTEQGRPPLPCRCYCVGRDARAFSVAARARAGPRSTIGACGSVSWDQWRLRPRRGGGWRWAVSGSARSSRCCWPRAARWSRAIG